MRNKTMASVTSVERRSRFIHFYAGMANCGCASLDRMQIDPQENRLPRFAPQNTKEGIHPAPPMS
jgi:hypothetical protein